MATTPALGAIVICQRCEQFAGAAHESIRTSRRRQNINGFGNYSANIVVAVPARHRRNVMEKDNIKRLGLMQPCAYRFDRMACLHIDSSAWHVWTYVDISLCLIVLHTLLEFISQYTDRGRFDGWMESSRRGRCHIVD